MGSKEPKTKEKITTEKKPKSIGIPTSPQNLTWSFSILDLSGPFGWDKCLSHEKFLEILTKKKQFEGMSHTELSETGSHAIESFRLSKEARDRLIALKLDDQDEVFSLRLTGKNRVFCIKDGGVMRILWWDPDHQVYPVFKSHT